MATLKNTNIDDTGYLKLPVGTTAQRPASPSVGYMRWNTTDNRAEVYTGTQWEQVGYERYVSSGLLMFLDAGNADSYPASGTTWTDLTPNSNNGTLINGVGYNSDNGGYLTFDGSDDYIDTTFTDDISSEFTFQFWFYATKTTVHFPAQMFINADNNTVFRVERYSAGSNTIEFGHSPSGGSIGANELISSNFANDTWHCCTLVYDGDYKYIYKNDTLDQTSASGQVLTHYSGAFLRLGARQDGTLLPMSGNMSIVMMYNRALSSSEISQNFNVFKQRYGL